MARRLFGGGERHRGRAVERQARRRDDRSGLEVGGGERNGGNVDAGQVDDVRANRRAAGEEGIVKVAESGLRTRADLDRLASAGYDAFLVGERLIAQPDPGAALRELRG